MKTVLALLLLFAGPAVAQPPVFLEPARGELKKLSQASHDIGSIFVRIASLRQFQGEPAVPLATHVKAFAPQLQFVEAAADCGGAAEHFAGVAIRLMPQGLPRPLQVAGAFAAVDRCVTRLQNARPGLAVLAAADSSQAANVTDVDRIVASLESIDRSLTYALPYASADVPLIGNHGDLEIALKAHASINVYAKLKYGALLGTLQEVDGATSVGSSLRGTYGSLYDHYYEMLEAVGTGHQRHAATWLASLGVVIDSERAIIERDALSGSGLRGFDFFRLRRQDENVGAEGYNFTKLVYDFNGQPGRQPTAGMGQSLYLFQFAWAFFGDVVMGDPAADGVELRRRWAGLKNIVFESDSEWVYVDKVSGAYGGFHHGLALPPNICLEPNVCVAPGTPTECPECPPPVCPSFSPATVQFGAPDARVEVRCVQQ